MESLRETTVLLRKPEQFQFISYNNYERLKLSTLISQWSPKLKINQSDREKLILRESLWSDSKSSWKGTSERAVGLLDQHLETHSHTEGIIPLTNTPSSASLFYLSH